jgi:hypothetical protein
MTDTDRLNEQRIALAQTIADQAQAIADGTLIGPQYGAVRRLLNNAEMLAAWTADDRSGMQDSTLQASVRRELEHVRQTGREGIVSVRQDQAPGVRAILQTEDVQGLAIRERTVRRWARFTIRPLRGQGG